jgi:hypothetical protein
MRCVACSFRSPTSSLAQVSGSETFSSDGLCDSLLTIQCASEVRVRPSFPFASLFYFLCYSDMRDILNCESERVERGGTGVDYWCVRRNVFYRSEN